MKIDNIKKLGFCNLEIQPLIEDFSGREITPDLIESSVGYFKVKIDGIFTITQIYKIIKIIENFKNENCKNRN